MKQFVILILIIFSSVAAKAITLEECRQAARKNSPLIKQFPLNSEISSRERDNLSTNYYPQFSVDAQATYQSDVFSLPIKIPGIVIPSPDKDQYQASLSVNQLLWDGGATKNNIEIKEAMLELSNASLEAKLYRLNEIINGLYFNILLIDKNIALIGKSVETLESNLVQINSLVDNGVLLPSNRKSIEIEKLRLTSQLNGMKNDKRAAKESLEYWIGTNIITDDFSLPKPEVPPTLEVNRPELSVYDANMKINEQYEDLANVSVMPKVALFGKAGYGKPNPFNFTENEWKTYYQVGVRFSWAPFDWFNSNRNVEIAQMKSKSVETEKADFLQNIEISAIRDKNEIIKLTDMIRDDKLIIAGQKQIADEKFSLLKNGSATSTEYIVEFNKYVQSEINASINEIKLELGKINLLNKYGK